MQKDQNQKSGTEVTVFSLFGQKRYFSLILNLHNGYWVSQTIFLTKAGNTSTSSTRECSKQKSSDKVCAGRRTVWITQWQRTSLAHAEAVALSAKIPLFGALQTKAG